jgi:hypothetical protein
MDERALTLDEEQLSPTPRPFDDEPFGGAGEKVGDDGVDGDAPAGDRDARLAGGDEDRSEPACARRAVELDGDRLLADRAVRADREDNSGGDAEVLAARDVEIGRRLAQVAELDAVLAGEGGHLFVVAQELVEPVLDVQPGDDRLLEQLAPGGRKAAALRGHADQGRVRFVLQPLLDSADDRDLLVALAGSLGVDDRDRGVRAVRDDAPHRLAVVRVVRLALSES